MTPHRRTAIAIAAALAATAPPAAAQPAATAAAPAIPEPVREERPDLSGQAVEVFVYRLGPVAWEATIAQRHWLARRLAQVTEPTDFSLDCFVGRFGRASRECAATGGPGTIAEESAALAFADVVVASLPLFPRAADEFAARRVTFTARYDPGDAPRSTSAAARLPPRSSCAKSAPQASTTHRARWPCRPRRRSAANARCRPTCR